MTVGEFRKIFEGLDLPDDFEMVTASRHSDSFNDIVDVEVSIQPTPAGDCKELRLFIDT